MAKLSVHQAFEFGGRVYTPGVYEVDDAACKAILESDNGKHLTKHGKLVNQSAPLGVTKIEARTEAPKSRRTPRKSQAKARQSPKPEK